MNTKIIVFDLYNTLVRIEKNHHFFLYLYKISSGFGLSTKAYKNFLLTQNIDKVIKFLPKEFEQLLNENQVLLKQELSSVVLFEDTKPILEKLSKDYQLFLISNLASPYKTPFFDLGLDKYFEKSIFSCDVGLMKPQKEIFQVTESITKKKGKEILMIGDSEKADISGAKYMNWNYLKICRNKADNKSYAIETLYQIEEFINLQNLCFFKNSKI